MKEDLLNIDESNSHKIDLYIKKTLSEEDLIKYKKMLGDEYGSISEKTLVYGVKLLLEEIKKRLKK